MGNTELLPCPFCGSETICIHEGISGNPFKKYREYKVMCKGCLASSHWQRERESAIRIWNMRVNDDGMNPAAAILVTDMMRDIDTALQKNENWQEEKITRDAIGAVANTLYMYGIIPTVKRVSDAVKEAINGGNDGLGEFEEVSEDDNA